MQQQRIDRYNNKKREHEALYGNPDIRIILDKSEWDAQIAAWDDRQLVFICGKMYKYSDVINCQISDTPRIERGEQVHHTDHWKAGPYPYVFGGGDAGYSETTITQEDDVMRHDYTVFINVNDISNPTIRIRLWGDMEKAQKINGLINVILNKKIANS
jgi:hypothetical protein